MKIIWNQYGGLPECPYFRRWAFIFKKWSIRLHRWYGDDDTRAPHNHPYWFFTFVLWGGYTDVSYEVDEEKHCTVKDIETLRRFNWRFRPAEHLHCVTEVRPNTWTLLITGPSIFRWGFWLNKKLIKRDKYFAVHGHHPCDGSENGVRINPEGKRV